MRRSRRTTSQSASDSMFSISSGGSQASGGWRYLRPEDLGQAQEGLPELAVAIDEDARPGVGDGVQALQQPLDVGQVGDHVDEQDHVEGPAGLGRAASGRRRRPRRSGGCGRARARAPPPPPGPRRRCPRRGTARGRRARGRCRSRCRAPAGPAGMRAASTRSRVRVEEAMAAPGRLDPGVVLLVEPPHLLEEGIVQRAGVLEERSLLYHSMVLRRPSSKGTWARKPKSRSAREVSRQRRGWPSGWLGSQQDLAR